MFLKKETMQKYLEARFRVTPGCWVWTGSLSPKGYGKLQIGNFHYRAHRVSYYVYNGDVPDDLMVMHKCDNPSCVNPDHLELGTNADNMQAKRERKRAASGQRHGMAKLTDIQRTEIEGLLEEGLLSMRQIADMYDVSLGAIGNIKYGHK